MALREAAISRAHYGHISGVHHSWSCTKIKAYPALSEEVLPDTSSLSPRAPLLGTLSYRPR